jgi:TolA-binding protein
MAKQRPSTKSKAHGSSAASKPGRAASAAGKPRRAPVSAVVAPARPQPAAPPRRSTYIEAVAIYERGLEALQRHDYHGAIDLLESVLRLYPEEKELHERVRL